MTRHLESLDKARRDRAEKIAAQAGSQRHARCIGGCDGGRRGCADRSPAFRPLDGAGGAR
jgi:hypothetical protein